MSDLKITWQQALELATSLTTRDTLIITQVEGGPRIGTPAFMAHFDSYDGAEDSNSPTGSGATAQDALDAFIEELERRAG